MIILFTVTGCSNKEMVKHDYTYKGENEFWTAEYKVKGESGFVKKGDNKLHKSDSRSILTVTYKKDLSELSSIKHFKISYKSSTGETGRSYQSDKNNPLNKKTYTIENTSKDTVIESKDEIIKVSIDIDGKVQTIELKNANS